jgi:protein involved in temperature-dependent protein secretion
MKALALLKLQKLPEAADIVAEVKSTKPTDPVIAKHLIQVFNDMGQYQETTALLEYVMAFSLENEELSEELFFSYVREGKLLKQ